MKAGTNARNRNSSHPGPVLLSIEIVSQDFAKGDLLVVAGKEPVSRQTPGKAQVMKRYLQALIAVSASAGLVSVSSAQETTQAETISKRPSYVENFNGEDRETMLGGQLAFANADADTSWIETIAGGKLIFESRLQANKLHYQDIGWVRYEGENTLSSTRDATIAVSVEPQNEGMGGAGILVGSGKAGSYLAFVVDKQDRFHVVQKAGRTTRVVYSGKSEHIRVGAANRITFDRSGDTVTFFVNGADVITVPLENRNAPQVGLAAFGIGIFAFDDVEITK